MVVITLAMTDVKVVVLVRVVVVTVDVPLIAKTHVLVDVLAPVEEDVTGLAMVVVWVRHIYKSNSSFAKHRR